MGLLFCFADKGAILYHVSCKKSYGFDDWIHGLCDVSDAEISRKYG